MLIKCQDCGRQVSSSAESCPHCGNTKFLEQHRNTVQEAKKEREEAIARYEEQARSEGFKNADEKKKAEVKKWKKETRKKELNNKIVGAVGCMLPLVLLLILMFGLIFYGVYVKFSN